MRTPWLELERCRLHVRNNHPSKCSFGYIGMRRHARHERTVSSRQNGANGVPFRFMQFAGAQDECELHGAKCCVQTKTDAICSGPAHPNLSGLLQRCRAAQQLVLESRCLSRIDTAQSGLISHSDMLHSHFSTPSNVLQRLISER